MTTKKVTYFICLKNEKLKFWTIKTGEKHEKEDVNGYVKQIRFLSCLGGWIRIQSKLLNC